MTDISTEAIPTIPFKGADSDEPPIVEPPRLQPAPLRLLTFDIEVETPIEDWEAAREGQNGLSSMVIYDTATTRYHLYDRRTLDVAVEHLETADMLVSFNGIGFDLPIIGAVSGHDMSKVVGIQHYDILLYAWEAVGGRQIGFRLAQIAERTLGFGKNSGKTAPLLVSEGRFAELYDYNLQDVWLTRKLFNHILDYGWIKDISDDILTMRKPEGVIQHA